MKKKQEKYLPLTKNIKEEDIPAFLSSQVEGTHVYAVTLQEDNFTKLESEKTKQWKINSRDRCYKKRHSLF